jgi:hypothetical protein
VKSKQQLALIVEKRIYSVLFDDINCCLSKLVSKKSFGLRRCHFQMRSSATHR